MTTTIDGIWDTVTETPLGAQKATLTLTTAGGVLTGTTAGAMGTMSIENGKVEGRRATWRMHFKGIALSADVTFDGNQLSGGISAPGFGTSSIKGQRQS